MRALPGYQLPYTTGYIPARDSTSFMFLKVCVWVNENAQARAMHFIQLGVVLQLRVVPCNKDKLYGQTACTLRAPICRPILQCFSLLNLLALELIVEYRRQVGFSYYNVGDIKQS